MSSVRQCVSFTNDREAGPRKISVLLPKKSLKIITQIDLKKMDGRLLTRLHPLEELQGINDP